MKTSALPKPRVADRQTRSSSGAAQLWRSPQHVATFVRCLRLLDLDRLEDWPGITQQTFSTKLTLQNLQQRVKATEWGLYRLFEIYDVAVTADKLRPFFPPQSPLQSLNLRAALFRTLADLKKNGVFPKEVVLRKTMLDECKGEKFEEVISAFAMIVLRNHAAASVPGGTERVTDDQALPLIIAYRKSLQKNLQTRRRIDNEAQTYAHALRRQQDELKVAREARNQDKESSGVDKEQAQALEDLVRTAWVGDDRWTDILLYGAPQEDQKVPGLPFDGPIEVKLEPSLLDDLSGRVAAQDERLRRWTAFHDHLKAVKEARELTSKAQATTGQTAFLTAQLDASQDLHRSRNLAGSSDQPEMVDTHRPVLESLDDKADPLGHGRTQEWRDEAGRFHSFDPIAVHKTQSGAPQATSEVLPGPYPQDEEAVGVESTSSPATHVFESSELYTDPLRTTQISDAMLSDEVSSLQLDSSGAQELSESRVVLAENLTALSLPEIQPTSSAETHPRGMSLLERTQMSMALLNSESTQSSSPPKFSSPSKAPLWFSPPRPEQRNTLLQRTRESMSLLPNMNSTKKDRRGRKSTVKQSRFSQAFPVNQFETPGKSRQQAEEWSPRSGSSTPRDKLFSDEAEYASVFKSRPRIALSPALSPERSGISLDSLLKEEMGDLTLGPSDDDGNDGTPMRRAR